jgi:type II secretory pathway pseudopilin PulG
MRRVQRAGRATGRCSERGVTLIEATVVLAVTAILVAVAAPVASRSVDTARLTRAQEDADAIAEAIDNFIADFGFVPFTVNGLNTGTTVQMLVSDGDIPLVVAGGGAEWDDVVNTSAAAPVDFLERHLVTNTPAYTTAGTTPWRGAYISSPVDADPWGNRYAVNTLYLRTSTANDVFVYSAGADEEVNTLFTLNGARPGNDDIISIVRRDLGKTVP